MLYNKLKRLVNNTPLMKLFLYMTLISFFSLSGCMQKISSINPAFDIEKKSLNLQPSISIAVITDETEPPDWTHTWYKVINNKYLKKLDNIPNTSADFISDFTISPNDKFLAVISSEDTVPCITVFKLDDLFIKRKQNKDKLIDSISAYCPASYSINMWISGWENDNVLLIKSRCPLDLMKKRAGDSRDYLDEGPINEYKWDIFKDTITKK